jgi:hypothetical protein
MLVGKTMFISVAIDAGNNSNATPAVFVDIPGGFTASKDDYAWAEILDSGVLIANSLVKTSAGATRISFTSLVGNIAVNAANGLYVRGQIAFEVQ